MKKFLKVIFGVLISIFIFVISINIWMVSKYNKNANDIDNVDKKYDIALVLGCSVLRNGEPSKMLRDRLNKAIEVYEKGLVEYILVSGDYKPNVYDEVNVMKKYLINNGIPKEVIITDYKGHNTSTSIKNLLDDYKDKSFIIITQKYHLYRSLYLSDKYKINAIGIYADKISYYGDTFRELREVLARVKDFLIK